MLASVTLVVGRYTRGDGSTLVKAHTSGAIKKLPPCQIGGTQPCDVLSRERNASSLVRASRRLEDHTRSPCPIGTFGPGGDYCLPCSGHANTSGIGTRTSDGCVCKAGYYRESSTTSAVHCEPCSPLAICHLNATVATLELKPGTWRLSDRTEDLQVCKCQGETCAYAESYRCECTGTNNGAAAAMDIPELWGDDSYGSSCAVAWDLSRAYCMPGGGSENASWCLDKWCYVDESCPGRKSTDTFSGTEHDGKLFYSYEHCGDVDTYERFDNKTFSIDTPCLGGGAAGSNGDGFCRPGHVGPRCEACIETDRWFDPSTERCEQCPGNVPWLVASPLLAVGVLFIGAVAYHALAVHFSWLQKARMTGGTLTTDFVVPIFEKVLIPILKISIGFFQIVGVLTTVYGTVLPAEFTFWLRLLSLDLLDWLVPGVCVGSLVSRLCLHALWPFALALTLLLAKSIFQLAQQQRTRGKSFVGSLRELLREDTSGRSSRTLTEDTSGRSSRILTEDTSGRSSIILTEDTSGRSSRILTFVLPVLLPVIFCLLIPVSRFILRSIGDCEGFGSDDLASTRKQRTFLRLDMRVECWSGTHRDEVLPVSWCFAGVWPIGCPLLFLVLLTRSPKNRKLLASLCDWCRVVTSSRTDDRDRALVFLTREYRPLCFLWEVVELIRRLTLTGFVLFISTERPMARLMLALWVSILFLALTLYIKPYHRNEPLVVSAVLQLSLILIFMACMALQICERSGECQMQFRMSTDVVTLFVIVMIMCALGFVVAFFVGYLSSVAYRWKRRRDAYAAEAPTKHSVAQDIADLSDHMREIMFSRLDYYDWTKLACQLAKNEDAVCKGRRADLRHSIVTDLRRSIVEMEQSLKRLRDEKCGAKTRDDTVEQCKKQITQGFHFTDVYASVFTSIKKREGVDKYRKEAKKLADLLPDPEEKCRQVESDLALLYREAAAVRPEARKTMERLQSDAAACGTRDAAALKKMGPLKKTRCARLTPLSTCSFQQITALASAPQSCPREDRATEVRGGWRHREVRGGRRHRDLRHCARYVRVCDHERRSGSAALTPLHALR